MGNILKNSKDTYASENNLKLLLISRTRKDGTRLTRPPGFRVRENYTYMSCLAADIQAADCSIIIVI